MELYFARHALRFARIPKNACSTVIMTLGGDLIPDERPHRHVRQFAAAPEGSLAWPRIVVHRDPYERLVSAYLNKIARPSPSEPFAAQVVRTIIRNRHDRSWSEPTGEPRVPVESVSFAEFVQYVCSRPDDDLDVHWRSQSSFVRTAGAGSGKAGDAAGDAAGGEDHTSKGGIAEGETGEGETIFLDMADLEGQWRRVPALRDIPLRTFAPHATTATLPLARQLVGTPGHQIIGYRAVTGTWPPKTCFDRPDLRRLVRDRFRDDYALIERVRSVPTAPVAAA